MANYNSDYTGAQIDSAVSRANSTDVTAGTVAASKAVVVDSNKDITGFRHITATGTVTAANVSLTGNVDLGDASGDTVTITGSIDSNLIPATDDTYDIGSATYAWQDLFLEGDITFSDAGTIATTAGDLTINAGSGEIQFGNENLTTTGTIDSGSQAVTGNVVASGTVQYGSLSDGAITITAFVDEDNMSSDSATLVPTQQSVKAYVDSTVTAQDLDFSGDSGGALNIDLDSESLTLTGGTGVVTVGSGNTMTFNSVDSEIVHDSLSGFVANEHIDHTAVTLTAGVGLSGGGTIAANRTFTVDLNELTTETTIADADFIAMVDATDDGSGKITFENLEDAIFASVSGDITITEGGVAAIQANSVVLGTDTTGNYVATVADSGGGGITVANSGSESAAVTLELDIKGLTDDAIASGDFIAFSDEGESGDPANRGQIDDVATLFAGTGLTASSAVIGVDANQTQIVQVGTLAVGAISSGFGAIDIGSSTANFGATTVDSLSASDGNITNVGDIALDSISADGTDINIAVSDNSATALTVKQGSAAYLIIDTANSSESVAIGTGISGTAVSIGHGTSETIVNDNLTVTGDLTVSGTTTTVSSGTLTIGDTLIKLGQAYTGSAYDQGIVFTRGDGSSTNTQNMAFIWDESADTFAAIKAATEAGTTSGNVTITDHVPLRVGALTADDASTFTSTISTATGSTIGNLTFANGSITDSSGAISFGDENLTTSGTLGAGVITATGLTIGSAVITEAELEILDGASLTTTELNYVDGVTSAIQTQIDTKAPLASPTFTGTITIGSAGISETELEILDGLTVTTDELNIMDGSATTQATVTLAGTDGVVISDGDVMKQALVSDFEVYMEANLDTMGSQFTSASGLATVGALNSGSITSGFGTIDTGSSNITTTGVGAFGSLDISGAIDVAGTTNLDVVDIDGAVDMASTLVVNSTTTIKKALSSDTQTTPETILTLGSTYSSTGSDGGAGSGSRLEFNIPDDDTNPITGSAIAGLKENADDGISSSALAFYTSQDDTTLDEAMRITSSGNVGIGETPDAASRLLVDHDQNAYTRILVKNTDTGSAAQSVTHYETDVGSFTCGAVSDAHSLDGSALLWHVPNKNMVFATNNTLRMTIEADGTVSTTGAFQPAGNVTCGADLTVNGGDVTISNSGGHAYLNIDSHSNEASDSAIAFRSGTTERGYIYYDHNTTAASQKMVFNVGDNAVTAMTILGNGNVGIGTASPASPFSTLSSFDGYAWRLDTDGDDANNSGLEMLIGTNDGSGTNYDISFKDGNGSTMGHITHSGGTVTYGTFTANHDIELPNSDNENGYPYGTLLEHTEIFYKQNINGEDFERGILYKAQKSSSAYSKNVIGAYAGKYHDKDNLHQTYVLGDGHILCNGEKGNILIGDGICSSSTNGQGMKADKMAMIIGIAQKNISFSGSESKLVPVQYSLQQFTPWSD